MKSFVVNFIVGLILVFFLSGCGAKTIINSKVDANNKSIIIGGTGMFSGTLRNEFKNRGWIVTTQFGTEQVSGKNIRGNLSYQKGINYKAKYSLNCNYQQFNFFDGLRYTYVCSMFDNYKGVDVFNITKTSPPAVSMSSVVDTIFEQIEYDYTKVKNDKNEYKSLKVDNTYYKNGLRYSSTTKSLLDGKYKILNENNYNIIIFNNGKSTKSELYDINNNLLSKVVYKNNYASKIELYFSNGLLRGIIPLKGSRDKSGNVIKNGEAEYFNEIGDIHYKVLYKDNKLISGVIYDEDNPRPMTRAHFRNFGLE